MRLRSLLTSPLFAAALAALSFVPSARAQDQSSGDPRAGGLVPGDYLRFSAGATSPVNAKGTLRDWGSGESFHLTYESWGSGASGVDLASFGLSVGYTLLPLKADEFVKNFVPTLVGGTTQTASASSAGILEVMTSFRIRIPAPYVMPYVNVGFGFMNWHPATIHYTTSTGASGDATRKSRSGAEFSLAAGLDRQLSDRFGIFGEAMYAYGFTSYGQGLATPGGTCAAAGCDALRNTSLGSLNGGLRVRIGR